MATGQIFLNLSKRLEDKIAETVSSTRCPNSLRICLESIGRSRSVPLSTVSELHNFLAKEEDVYLHELLEGSDVVLPEVKRPERNLELEARCDRLRAEQANMAYRRMVEDIDTSQKNNSMSVEDFGTEMKKVNRQLVSVVNFLVTVGGAFAFGYKATEYSLGVPNIPIQLCAALVLSTIVFFADLYFLLMYNID